MLLNAHNRPAAAFHLYLLLLCIGGITALPRAGHHVSHNRTAFVGYQQPLARNHTQWQQFNRTQHGHGVFNQTRHQVAHHVQYPPAFGQQGNWNKTRPGWQQPAAHGHMRPVNYPYPSPGAFSRTRQQAFAPGASSNYPQYPSNGQQHYLNRARPAVWHQPSAPQSPNYPAHPNQSNLHPKLPTVHAPHPSGRGNNGVPNSHVGNLTALSYP